MSVIKSDSIKKEQVKAAKKTYKQVLIGPDQGPHFAMRRFIIEPGGEMPLHTNSVEHEQFVLNGSARVIIGDDVFMVKKNDVVFIPAGVKHSYKTSGAVAFEFLCIIPNQEDIMELIK